MALEGSEDLKIDALLQDLEDAEAADQVGGFPAECITCITCEKAGSAFVGTGGHGRWYATAVRFSTTA